MFYGDPPGAILSIAAHKGYALGVLTELLAGSLAGGGASNPENAKRLANGMLSIFFDPKTFQPENVFAADVHRFVDWVKSSAKSTAGGEILMPGEIEERTKAQRLRDGIELDDNTWKGLVEAGARWTWLSKRRNGPLNQQWRRIRLMLDHVLRAAEGNVDYARRLVADIPEEQMAAQPAPGMNHAAWVLGHLAYVFDSMTAVWGQEPTMSKEWKQLFNVPSKPQPEREKYPSKAELWDAYEKNYQRIVDIVKAATPEDFDKEFPNPKLRPCCRPWAWRWSTFSPRTRGNTWASFRPGGVRRECQACEPGRMGQRGLVL